MNKLKEAFKQGFEKEANFLNQSFKKFRAMGPEELETAVKNQGAVKKTKSFFEWLGMPADELDSAIDDAISGKGKHIGGTIYEHPSGKTGIGINKKLINGDPSGPLDTRGVIAHEAFHANRPVLGRSEIAAHLYGGARSNTTNMAEQLGHAFKTRPVRATGELGVTGGAGYGAYEGASGINSLLSGSNE